MPESDRPVHCHSDPPPAAAGGRRLALPAPAAPASQPACRCDTVYVYARTRPRERRHDFLRRYRFRGVDVLRRQQQAAPETDAPACHLDRSV